MMNKAQADIAYAFVGSGAPILVLRGLGHEQRAWSYALGGRLGDSIRERQGMAYYVYSTLDASLARAR